MQLLNVDGLLIFKCHACVNASISVYGAEHMFVGKGVSDV